MRASGGIHDERITTYGLLHEAHGRLSHAFEQTLLRRVGISAALYELLLRVARSGEGRVKMSDLARQMAVTTGGATRIADRAQAAGLVERQPCPGDRRIQYLALTDRGRAVLDKATRVHLRDLQHEMVDRLTADELEALHRIAHKLRRPDRMEPMEAEGAA